MPKWQYQNYTTLIFPQKITEDQKKVYQDQLNKALETHKNDANNPVLYADIGIVKAGLQDYDGAAEAFKKAISIKGDDPRFHRNLAITYNYSEKYPEAEKEFREAFKLSPQSPEYWLELGELYTFKMQDTKKARTFYVEALQKTNNKFEVMQAYANFLETIEKDYSTAIEYYQKLADASDTNKVAFLKRIEELKLKLGQRVK